MKKTSDLAESLLREARHAASLSEKVGPPSSGPNLQFERDMRWYWRGVAQGYWSAARSAAYADGLAGNEVDVWAGENPATASS